MDKFIVCIFEKKDGMEIRIFQKTIFPKLIKDLSQHLKVASTLSAALTEDQVTEKWRISSEFDTNIRDSVQDCAGFILMT